LRFVKALVVLAYDLNLNHRPTAPNAFPKSFRFEPQNTAIYALRLYNLKSFSRSSVIILNLQYTKKLQNTSFSQPETQRRSAVYHIESLSMYDVSDNLDEQQSDCNLQLSAHRLQSVSHFGLTKPDTWSDSGMYYSIELCTNLGRERLMLTWKWTDGLALASD
jgi:hypothetical protein